MTRQKLSREFKTEVVSLVTDRGVAVSHVVLTCPRVCCAAG